MILNDVSNEGLWNKPQVKATVTEDGVKLMDVVEICRKTGGLLNASQSEIEAILCGEVSAWRVHEVRAKGNERWQLSLIGRTVTQRWFRRGDFGIGPSYSQAGIEVEVKSGAVKWTAVIAEPTAKSNRDEQKTSKHGGVSLRVAATA